MVQEVGCAVRGNKGQPLERQVTAIRLELICLFVHHWWPNVQGKSLEMTHVVCLKYDADGAPQHKGVHMNISHRGEALVRKLSQAGE